MADNADDKQPFVPPSEPPSAPPELPAEPTPPNAVPPPPPSSVPPPPPPPGAAPGMTPGMAQGMVPPPPAFPVPPPPPAAPPVVPLPAAPGSPTNTLAVLSLVFGILAIPLGCTCMGILGFAGGGAAITMGIIGLNQIKKGTGAPGGRGLAIAGISCGGVALVIPFAFLLFFGFSILGGSS